MARVEKDDGEEEEGRRRGRGERCPAARLPRASRVSTGPTARTP